MGSKAAHLCVVEAHCGVMSFTLFLLLSGCNGSTQQAPQNASSAVVTGGETYGVVRPEYYPLLLNRLRQLAGEGALDCGMVEPLEPPDAASNCALKAQKQKTPFFVRYAVQGIDTEQVLGFAGTSSGDVSSVWYFGKGYSTGVRPDKRSKNLRSTDDGRISIEDCSKPINFRLASSGRVTCFLRDP
jgi:hypothetical protein